MKYIQIAVLLIYAEITSAQLENTIGGKIGLNYAGMYGKNIQGSSLKPGLILGIITGFDLSKKIIFFTGIDFENKSIESYFNIYLFIDNIIVHTDIIEAKTNFYHIGVPAYFNFSITRKFFINFGLYAEYLIYKKTILSNYDFGSPYTDKNLRKTDFGTISGIGFLIPIDKKIHLLIEARNYFGLSPIFNKNSSEFSEEKKGNLYSFNFSLGILIDLKRNSSSNSCSYTKNKK